MKKIILLLVAFILISCYKKNKINHYLAKPITQEELENNGFYKYSYTATLDDEDKIDDTIKSVARYDMYSNVKPEINEEGKLCPTQLWNFHHEDSIKRKKNWVYVKNKLNNRIITYFFRNDSLFYKDIKVESFDNQHKEIADFTSREKIINYYDSLKIPIKPIIKNSKTGEIFTGRFMINTYRTYFYWSENNKSYEIFINYLNNFSYYNIQEDWYSGHIYKTYYFD